MKPIDVLRLENSELRKRLQTLNRELEHAQKQVLSWTDIRRRVLHLSRTPVRAPEWTLRATGPKVRESLVPVILLSDLHYAEVVRPGEVAGRNEYSTAIAEARLRRLTEKTVHLCAKHVGGSFDGCVLVLLGDMFSGEIHEDLTHTNEIEPTVALTRLRAHLVATVQTLRSHFGRVHVVCVTGNHGRMDPKPRSKHAAERSWDYLLYCLAEEATKGSATITWQVPQTPDALFSIRGTRFLATHGDKFRGGGGIQGALSPWMIGDYRLRKRQRAMGEDYDYLIMGHWHQLSHVGGIIVNGSVKGFDEYATRGQFPFEPPQQWLFVVRGDGRIAYWLPVFLD